MALAAVSVSMPAQRAIRGQVGVEADVADAVMGCLLTVMEKIPRFNRFDLLREAHPTSGICQATVRCLSRMQHPPFYCLENTRCLTLPCKRAMEMKRQR